MHVNSTVDGCNPTVQGPVTRQRVLLMEEDSSFDFSNYISYQL